VDFVGRSPTLACPNVRATQTPLLQRTARHFINARANWSWIRYLAEQLIPREISAKVGEYLDHPNIGKYLTGLNDPRFHQNEILVIEAPAELIRTIQENLNG
jgi:hypothetical protein